MLFFVLYYQLTKSISLTLSILSQIILFVFPFKTAYSMIESILELSSILSIKMRQVNSMTIKLAIFERSLIPIPILIKQCPISVKFIIFKFTFINILKRCQFTLLFFSILIYSIEMNLSNFFGSLPLYFSIEKKSFQIVFETTDNEHLSFGLVVGKQAKIDDIFMIILAISFSNVVISQSSIKPIIGENVLLRFSKLIIILLSYACDQILNLLAKVLNVVRVEGQVEGQLLGRGGRNSFAGFTI